MITILYQFLEEIVKDSTHFAHLAFSHKTDLLVANKCSPTKNAKSEGISLIFVSLHSKGEISDRDLLSYDLPHSRSRYFSSELLHGPAGNSRSK